MSLRIHSPHVLIVAIAVAAMQAAAGQTTVAPRQGAGYVLPDGSIQIVAARGTTGLIGALNALFVETHPGIRFTVREGDNYSGMATLTFDTTAFAPLTSEYTRIGVGNNLKIAPEPSAFRLAHGSLKAGAALSPLAVIVNKANPLDRLSLDQLTRMFAVGAPGGDLTQWTQAGVQGSLGANAIHPCGPPGTDYAAFEDPQVGEFLSLRKMNGLAFNHTYVALESYDAVVKRVAEDPAAIGLVAFNHLTAEVKVLALNGARAGTPSRGAADDIRESRYPLDRFLWIYMRANPGMPFDPFAREYLHTVYSARGQQVIAANSEGYIPLNAREVADELARLDQ